jgi:hypothetical protein
MGRHTATTPEWLTFKHQRCMQYLHRSTLHYELLYADKSWNGENIEYILFVKTKTTKVEGG